MRSPIYTNRLIYESLMAVLCGDSLKERYAFIDGKIAEGSSVLDFCCGPGMIYRRHLKKKNVHYQGIDCNEVFVKEVNRLGGTGFLMDLHGAECVFPQADTVMMKASLYHFLPDDVQRMVTSMYHSARVQLIIAEPIVNYSNHANSWLSYLGQRLSDPGTGRGHLRFAEYELDGVLEETLGIPNEVFYLSSKREKIYVYLRGRT